MMAIQGNLVDSKAILQTAGKIIAATQRTEFHVSIFFFSDFVMVAFGLICLVR